MENSQFKLALLNMIGFDVKLYTVDGSTVKGLLKGIQNDYLEVESEGTGTTYFRLQNIKGIAKNVKDYQKKTLETSAGSPNLLRELLKQLKHQWVTINGQKELSGILSSIEDDYVMLLGKNEQILLNTSQVDHFSKPGFQSESNGTADKNDEQNSQVSGTANNTNTASVKNTEGKQETKEKSSKKENKEETGCKAENVKDYQAPISKEPQTYEYSIFGPNPDDYYASARRKKRKKCRKKA